MMTQRELLLAMGLAARAITPEQFAKDFPADVNHLQPLALELCESAERDQDSLGISVGMTLAYAVGFSASFLPVLLRLALVDWHDEHEAIAAALKKLRMPESVDVLRQMAVRKYPSRASDEGIGALAGKAVHALGAIGTPAALDALTALARDDDPIVAEWARDHLEFLAVSERQDATVRAAAAAALSKLS